jgi:hypothetical protein
MYYGRTQTECVLEQGAEENIWTRGSLFIYGLFDDPVSTSDQGWPNLLNIGAAYDDFQKFGNFKQTWIGWHMCSGTRFHAEGFSYLNF